MTEQWKPIIIEKNGVVYDYTNKYEVSNMGRVRSLNYRSNGGIEVLKLRERKGYLNVGLCMNGKQQQFLVHRLVATAFIPNPNNLPEVNHRNENKYDCSINNLEWCDRKYNVNYGTGHKRSTKTQSKKVICLETGVIYESTMDVQRKLGLFNSNINNVCKGKRKTAGGYHWMYLDDYMREQ